MRYGEIKKCDIANGEGVRVSLFVSGCTHHCKGCFNEATWDFDYGKEFTQETEEEILKALEPEYVNGLSVLGGEPFEPQNQRALVPFLKKVKERYPGKTIWCYTGYLFDRELCKNVAACAKRIVANRELILFGLVNHTTAITLATTYLKLKRMQQRLLNEPWTEELRQEVLRVRTEYIDTIRDSHYVD